MPREFHRNPARFQVIEDARVCPGCGLLQRLPDLAAGHLARCLRCQCRLERHDTSASIFAPLALAITSALLYLVAIFQPLLTFDVYGRSRTISLLTGPLELVREGWAPVGALVMLATVVFPPIVIGLTLTLTVSVARERVSSTTARMLRWYNLLRPWSMVEVYILGVFVAYSKLIDLAKTDIGFSVVAIVGLMITMASTDATLHPEWIWRRKRILFAPGDDGPQGSNPARTDGDRVTMPPPAEAVRGPAEAVRGPDKVMPLPAEAIPGPDKAMPPPHKIVGCMACGLVCASSQPLEREAKLGQCPRCGEVLRRRKPDSQRRALALLVAAMVFYIPANLYPIMTIIKLYQGGGHTILEGVSELYAAGMLPLALLVFFASITVPVLKIASLGLMLFSTWRRSIHCLVDRSKLYWIIQFVGRWSMIDVFMVSILVGLVQFGQLGHITANAGIEAFAAVVVLTIFAADAFDPRLMWDAVGLNGAWDAAPYMQPARSRGREAVKA